ncbi:MAG: hypothetical protein JWN40_3095 [Phycisphaerales bacterium]|nr:hypothetical protein [Phycisphaerales bacterium]
MRTLIAALLVFIAPVVALAFQPTDHYEQREIEGWKVYVNQDLLADKSLSDRCLALLQVKLFDLQRVVPAAAVVRLKEVPIWMELNDPKFPGACYHPSKEWLKSNDVNPDKAGAVEIANAKNFLTWTIAQPWMVLHELAHSYHHRVLGYDNAEIKAAYKAAKESGKYEKVLHINGRTQRHYAMNNDQEYFAESSEAFFGTNDFYPFVRAEVKEFDPEMYAVLKRVWGVEGGGGAASAPAGKGRP